MQSSFSSFMQSTLFRLAYFDGGSKNVWPKRIGKQYSKDPKIRRSREDEDRDQTKSRLGETQIEKGPGEGLLKRRTDAKN